MAPARICSAIVNVTVADLKRDYAKLGIEQVWLKKITVAQYLQTMQDAFAKELKEGKVPPLPAR